MELTQEQLQERDARVRKDYRNALMQGGREIGTDFFNADGKVLGRFHGFIPAGATDDDIAAFFDAMAQVQRALKDAKPLDFGDLKWIG